MSMATITSKRQLTIPVKIFKKARLRVGDRVLVEEENGILRIESAVAAVERLAGSVKVPKRFRGVDIDKAIAIAKYRYFRERARR